MKDPFAQLLKAGRILLIDDEEDCDFVTRLVMKKAGFEGGLTSFTSAGAAMHHLRDRTKSPDIMFLDINMPGTSGFDLLAMCEAEGILPNARTSVVMFSSSNRSIL